MRLKITRRLSGSIDGVQLSHFEVGELYDVGTSLGSYLLALGAAEPAPDEAPAAVVPLPERPATDERKWSAAVPPGIAADRSKKQ